MVLTKICMPPRSHGKGVERRGEGGDRELLRVAACKIGTELMPLEQ
jgi:hypothetical protein